MGSPNVEWSAFCILTFLVKGSGVLFYLPVTEALLWQVCSSNLLISSIGLSAFFLLIYRHLKMPPEYKYFIGYMY